MTPGIIEVLSPTPTTPPKGRSWPLADRAGNAATPADLAPILEDPADRRTVLVGIYRLVHGREPYPWTLALAAVQSTRLALILRTATVYGGISSRDGDQRDFGLALDALRRLGWPPLADVETDSCWRLIISNTPPIVALPSIAWVDSTRWILVICFNGRWSEIT